MMAPHPERLARMTLVQRCCFFLAPFSRRNAREPYDTAREWAEGTGRILFLRSTSGHPYPPQHAIDEAEQLALSLFCFLEDRTAPPAVSEVCRLIAPWPASDHAPTSLEEWARRYGSARYRIARGIVLEQYGRLPLEITSPATRRLSNGRTERLPGVRGFDYSHEDAAHIASEEARRYLRFCEATIAQALSRSAA